MSRISARLLYWSPRMLTIAFALFLSLFALDVFDEFHGFWTVAAAFAIHLIPVYIVLAVLIAAWRWDWIGAGVFLLLAAYYAVHILDRNVKNWPAVVGISLPPVVIAGLFLASWMERAKLRSVL